MNRTTVRVLLALAVFSLALNAKDEERRDFDAGVALPGTGQATFVNPAGLPDLQSRMMDFAVDLQGYQNWIGHFSAGFDDKFGVGVGFMNSYGNLTLTPGVGINWGKVQIGFATSFVPALYGPRDYTIGLRWRRSATTGLGIVVYDAFTFHNWRVGFGFGGSESVSVELDFTGIFDHQMNITSLNFSPALVLKAGRKVSLLARAYMGLVPNFYFTSQNIELGILAWLGRKFAIYFQYQNPNSLYLGGVKLVF